MVSIQKHKNCNELRIEIESSIKNQVPESSFVTLKVYNVLGSEITILVKEEKPMGNYEVEFDGRGLPSGVYFYQLKAGNFIQTKKMVLMK